MKKTYPMDEAWEAKAGDRHIPVMQDEMLAAMNPARGEIYIDGTFGAGGYSRALLEAAECTVYAIDRDPNVAELAASLTRAFPGRFFWLMGNFGDMLQLLADKGVVSVSGIVLDIGLSSMQIDVAERGFSFLRDGPLDMRMSARGQTAGEIVNTASEEELADIFYYYGEERKARYVARAILRARAESPIAGTLALAEIVRGAVRARDGQPAAKSFQALRIHVNDELGELERALSASERLLAPGGRLVAVTFHSLEDRIVKKFLQSRSGETRGGSRHLPVAGEIRASAADRPPIFLLPHRKPVSPGIAETRRNPRARSAKLRLAIRTEAAC